MAHLRRALAQTEDGQGRRLAEVAAFEGKASALAIRLLGLRALAARCAAERLAGRDPGPLPVMLEVRSAELQQAIVELLVEAAGYYGMAAPDAVLLHNEGRIGPEWAAPAVRELLDGLQGLGPTGASDAQGRLIAALFEKAS